MDIANLFKWSTVCFIKDETGRIIKDENGEPIKVYIRVIGDNDLDECNRYSFKVSKSLRKDYESRIDELIPDISELDREQLISLIVLNEADQIYKQANREVEVKYPKDPQDLTLSEEERFEEEKAAYFDKIQAATIDKINELIDAQKEYYRQYDEGKLVDIAKKTYLDRILYNELTKAYNDAIIYYSTYDDEKFSERTFKSIEDVKDAVPFLKNQLNNTYQQLHLKDLELKKSF